MKTGSSKQEHFISPSRNICQSEYSSRFNRFCLLLNRQLCLLLHAENIFHSMADILLKEEDLKFASTMVQTLNTILLTSAELFQLRNQLKDLRTQVTSAPRTGIFNRLIKSRTIVSTWGFASVLFITVLCIYFLPIRKAVHFSAASIALGVTIQWPLCRFASWHRTISMPTTSSRNCILAVKFIMYNSVSDWLNILYASSYTHKSLGFVTFNLIKNVTLSLSLSIYKISVFSILKWKLFVTTKLYFQHHYSILQCQIILQKSF